MSDKHNDYEIMFDFPERPCKNKQTNKDTSTFGEATVVKLLMAVISNASIDLLLLNNCVTVHLCRINCCLIFCKM